MPGERDVHVVEQARSDHVGLAADVFLGGRAVEANRALQVTRGDQLLDRDAAARLAGPKRLWPQPCPGCAFFECFLRGLGFL